MSFGDDATPTARPPTFGSVVISVRPVGFRTAEINVAGVVVTLALQEGQALCTALRDAFEIEGALP